jgi:sterol desaturase/sphingolipid hydroxylase (fatty acid hydroxylase superfamily)
MSSGLWSAAASDIGLALPRLSWRVFHDTWLSSDSELFWVILIPQLAILWLVSRWSRGQYGDLPNVVTREAVAHRSTRVDVILLVIGTALTGVVARAAVTVPLVHVFNRVLPKMRLLSAPLASHHWLSLAVVGVVYIVAVDLGTYVAHVALHRSPVLWPFHAIHHEAPVMTPLTTYRTHPVESVVVGFVESVTTAIVLTVWVNLGAGTVSYAHLLGTNLLLLAFRSMFACARHSPRPMSFGPLDWVLISPSMHQLHHSRDEVFHDRNFGVVLSVWDRVFGTHVQPVRNQTYDIGVDGRTGTSLRTALAEPFPRAATAAAATIDRARGRLRRSAKALGAD